MLASSTTSSTTLVATTILVTTLSLVLFAPSCSIGTPLVVGLVTLIVAIIVIILVLIVFALASALLLVRHLRPTTWHSTLERHASLLERGL